MHSSNAEIPALSPAFTNLAQAKYQDEQSAARQIQDACQLSAEQSLRADAMGHLLSQKLRIARQNQAGIDNLLSQYPLSTPAGRALLNLAEAALRIPDHFQLDQFIEEQLHAADWHQHRGHSPSWLINFATLGLDLAESTHTPLTTPIFREAIKQALRLLASQFVIAEDITAALQAQNPDFRYSFDMLGEAALSPEEASVYLERYTQAIHQVGAYSQGAGQFGPAVSIKLSALCHKFDFLHYQQVHTELYPRLYQLALIAKQYDIGLTIDAEESHRQLLTLSLFERLMAEPDLLNWSGLGIAVQAYQKNALQVVKWLSQSTRQQHRAITVRLVKGAYWDSEIKWAQQAGLANYPVWTNKTLTDQSYLACARILLQAENRIFAQFATHNAFTLSTIHQMAGAQNCEFQALFGMGETLYQLAHELGIERPCRLYAPVGAHKELLPYLVRRFLENGANTSFVHQVLAEATRPELSNSASQHTLRQPNKLFLPRVSPALSDLHHWPDFIRLREDLNAQKKQRYIALPSNYIDTDGNTHLKTITNPALTTEIVGQYAETAFNEIETAFHTAELAQKKWQALGVSARAVLLEACADALEAKRVLLLDLLIREAGKTPINALQEFREAVDFCRYYAAQARSDWQHSCPAALGIVVAISPWNFPLAIFVGQIASALLAGNTVIAKPAPETPLIAAQAIECFYQAGIEPQVVQLLLGGESWVRL
ncbi:proline dehydrogenase family protein [Chitinibacter fontanus]|uniref:Proline dehydrogenase family protein n=1 Tax=Chitinibacter fontanus TaxID=1737446 RepID=A0A7D5VBD6_9NEIS|nr:proline dehydrogenase family protein [Chitinibacter fontanus]QLI82735.1 proline dehydrogenase family protein [Chitinibacter fontanus]